jgi:hypothetical protein
MSTPAGCLAVQSSRSASSGPDDGSEPGKTACEHCTAEQRSADGHSFRYIVERSPASLAAKLLTA